MRFGGKFMCADWQPSTMLAKRMTPYGNEDMAAECLWREYSQGGRGLGGSKDKFQRFSRTSDAPTPHAIFLAQSCVGAFIQ